MNILDMLISIYSSMYNRSWLPIWVLKPFRGIVRVFANFILPGYLKLNYDSSPSKITDVIVSFTSFPARIENVWQVVECMLRQTHQPSKILLWLSREQFPTYESIPQSLRCRQNKIFEIRLVDGDICSHKKYYYVSLEFPSSLIFLIDDDIYYPTTIIERSLKARQRSKGAVICNYGYHIGYNSNGSLLKYSAWQLENNYSDANDIFFGSGGGTLLIPSELYSDLTNIQLAKRLCPIADDIWLNAMVRLAGKKIILLNNGLILGIYNRIKIALSNQNIGMSKNDEQLMRIADYYKDTIHVKLWNL